MSTIPASSVVQINPGVISAGGDALDLIGLILTTDTRPPIGSVLSFGNAEAVGDYFGPSSLEKALSDKYFNGFSTAQARPGAILFTQYNEDAVAAYIRGGDVSSLTLAQLQALNGTLTVPVDGTNRVGGTVNLSAAVSFSSAATIIETALNSAPEELAEFTASIAGSVLTVSAVASGVLGVGQEVKGVGVDAGLRIVSLGTGTGGTGTYNLSGTDTVSSESMTTEPVDVTVTYDSVSGGFVVKSGITGVASSVNFATGTISDELKLISVGGAVLSQGAAAASPVAFMNAVVAQTQNWATFMTAFQPDDSGIANRLAFASWTNDQDERYAYVVEDDDLAPTQSSNAAGCLGRAISDAGYSGSFVLFDTQGDFAVAAFVCGCAASLNFDMLNGRTTFAFLSQSGLTASVTTKIAADNLIANGYNYYGAYATANQNFVFLYPGSISGDFLWMDTYINEIWLNNAFQLALMVLLTNIRSIPYNSAGNALIEAALADPINAGLNFGVFRPGVSLNAQQIAQVNSDAGAIIAPTLTARGWYLQILAASPEVRAARGSPPMNFWYNDGQSVQKLEMNSVVVQ